MSAPFIVPFNHQPVNTGASISSYTVPVGKYARVTISLCTEIGVSTSLNPSSGPSFDFWVEGGENSATQTFWLKAGDVVTLSTSSGSGSISTGVNSQIQKSSCVATGIINGTGILYSRANAMAFFATSGPFSASFNGNSNASIYYEEYNVIS